MTTVPNVPWALTHAAVRLVIECRRHRIASDGWRPLERVLEDEGGEARSPSRFFAIVADALAALDRLPMLPGAVATATDRVRAAMPVRP